MEKDKGTYFVIVPKLIFVKAYNSQSLKYTKTRKYFMRNILFPSL